MEKANIGFKAGIILEKLGETGLITIAELARRLNFAADETALAAGWLARENTPFRKALEKQAPITHNNDWGCRTFDAAFCRAGSK